MFDYASDSFSVKEKIEILFKEYDTLRAEIINRAGWGNQAVAIVAGLFAAILAWGATRPPAGAFWGAVAVVVVTSAGLLIITYRDINLVSRRIAEIESRINRLSGGDDLLGWESRLGSAASGWIMRRSNPV